MGDKPKGIMAMFVYGTLREEQGNSYLFGDALIRREVRVTANGRLYYAAYGDGDSKHQAPYPCARFDQEGVIVGDLIEITWPHPASEQVARMEIGAGYQAVDITVNTKDGERKAVGWQWMSRTIGEEISSGDWLEETGRKTVGSS